MLFVCQSRKSENEQAHTQTRIIILKSSAHSLVLSEAPHGLFGQLAPDTSGLALTDHAVPLAQRLALLRFLLLDLAAQSLRLFIQLV